MTAADEYQRVLGAHVAVINGICSCGTRLEVPESRIMDDAHRAHLAQALAADPGVRAALEREALERAARAMEAEIRRAQKGGWRSPSISEGARIVRDLMDRKEGE